VIPATLHLALSKDLWTIPRITCPVPRTAVLAGGTISISRVATTASPLRRTTTPCISSMRRRMMSSPVLSTILQHSSVSSDGLWFISRAVSVFACSLSDIVAWRGPGPSVVPPRMPRVPSRISSPPPLACMLRTRKSAMPPILPSCPTRDIGPRADVSMVSLAIFSMYARFPMTHRCIELHPALPPSFIITLFCPPNFAAIPISLHTHRTVSHAWRTTPISRFMPMIPASRVRTQMLRIGMENCVILAGSVVATPMSGGVSIGSMIAAGPRMTGGTVQRGPTSLVRCVRVGLFAVPGQRSLATVTYGCKRLRFRRGSFGHVG
jgi:hypothetical protein